MAANRTFLTPGRCCASPTTRGARLRDIAASRGITDRSAYGIVTDLAGASYVVKRDGRVSPERGCLAMIGAILIVLAVLVVLGVIAAGRSVRVVQQFEQGIVFRFGRIQSPPRGAGLTMIRPVGDRMQKVNMQIIAMTVPAQEASPKTT